MKTAKVFLHSAKDVMQEIGEKIGLTGKALAEFQYACYEVELDLEVDEATGQATIIAVDKHPVATRATIKGGM